MSREALPEEGVPPPRPPPVEMIFCSKYCSLRSPHALPTHMLSGQHAMGANAMGFRPLEEGLAIEFRRL